VLNESTSGAGSEPVIRLHHGTTRKRAELIIRNKPDPKYREPHGCDLADGFSTAGPEGPWPFKSPSTYAEGKARLFPDEGGPVILEIAVPRSIVCLVLHDDEAGVSFGPENTIEDLVAIIRCWGEVRFTSGRGIEELRDAWDSIAKRIIEL